VEGWREEGEEDAAVRPWRSKTEPWKSKTEERERSQIGKKRQVVLK